MPIKPEDVIGYLGLDLDTFDDVEKFKAHFNGEFLRRANAHTDSEVAGRVFGQLNGTMRSALNRTAKELGLEDDFSDIEKPIEGIDVIGRKVSERIKALSGELEKAKQVKAAPKELAELQGKLDAVLQENEAFKGDAKKWKGQHDALLSQIETEKTKAREDGVWQRAFDAVKWKEGVNKYTIKGFQDTVRGAHKLQFDDAGVKVLDAEGRIMMDPNKAQTFRDAADIVKELADKEGLTGGGAAPVKRVVSMTSAALGGNGQRQEPQHPERGPRVMPM